ncbi:hypothetical protein AB0M22_09285 [Nocardia sp. NPDC051756]|uniref:hypothetical protein n=1 Tax=Nocardia sp. NPDC051756 TaxID=3154751 RepID=UPI003420E6EC
MTLSPNDIDTAAHEVIAAKLARGVSHVEVEMILNGQPGRVGLTVAELGVVRDRVHAMFAAYIEAITPEAVA